MRKFIKKRSRKGTKRTNKLTRKILRNVEPLESRVMLSAAGFDTGLGSPDEIVAASTPIPAQPTIVNGTLIAESQYPDVGIVNGQCTGTLISPTHVLTADHCLTGGTGTFEIGGQTYTAVSQIGHPTADLGILVLSQEVTGVTPRGLLREAPVVGETLTLVGYGAGGTTGVSASDFGNLRVGTTELETVDSDLIWWLFDGNGESNTAPGDSGGPAFVDRGGELLLAGVTSGGTGNAWNIGQQDRSYDVRVDAFTGWIDDILTPPEDDHANDPAPGATEVVTSGDNAWSFGQLGAGGDRDAFAFTLDTATDVVLTAVSTDGSVDSILRLYNSNGVELATNDDIYFNNNTDFNPNSSISQSLVAGTYYYTVGSFNDSGVGRYATTIDFSANAATDQHGDTTANATSLSLDADGNTALRENLETNNDRDTFSFVVTETGTVRISATQVSADNNLQVDTRIELWDAAGTVIDENDDIDFNAGNSNSYLETSLSPGTYYASVFSFNGASDGEYVVAVDTTKTAVVVEPTADFDSDGDVDGADFLSWQTGFGTQTGATLSGGDSNQDGDVDGEDFDIFAATYGSVALASASQDIPGQASIVNGTPVAESLYPTVGIVNGGCSGTLIAPGHVLTAAHCTGSGSGTFLLGGVTYTAIQQIDHPTEDIAVLVLSQDVPGVTPTEILRERPIDRTTGVGGVGEDLILVGYGNGGTTGNQQGDFGTLREGHTELEEVTATELRWWMLGDQWNGVDESNTAYGDSGGPAFVDRGGVLMLAGVTSGSVNSNPDPWSNDHANDMRVDAFADWIDNVIDPPADDHVNTPGNDATLIVIDANGDGSGAGNIATSGDVDFFQFTLTESSNVVLDQMEDGSGVDTLMTLYDASGNEIETDDDGGDARNSRITTPLGAGLYYVSAGAYQTGVGTYTLDIKVTEDSGGGDDHVNAPGVGATALTIAADGTSQGTGEIEVNSDRDVFQFTVTADTPATITLNATGGGLDTYLRLYDSSNNLIAQDDDDGPLLNSELTTNLTAGTYYVSAAAYVGSASSTTGTYELDITVDPPTVDPIDGDFDENGTVDAVDFGAWESGFGIASGAALSNGDADGDGDVDGTDFLTWQTNYTEPAGLVTGGQSAPTQAEVATEPVAVQRPVRPNYRPALEANRPPRFRGQDDEAARERTFIAQRFAAAHDDAFESDDDWLSELRFRSRR